MKMHKMTRLFLGVMFLMTGLMKLVLPDFGHAFYVQLTEAKIPLVELNMWFVPIIEVIIGLMLVLNFKSIIALTLTIPILLVAVYVHIVVDHPEAFPAQPQMPIIPILFLFLSLFLISKNKEIGTTKKLS